MYTILINNDNTLEATQKTRIIQRSKLADTFCFFVPAMYNSISMADCTVLLEYLKPVSKEYKTEILTKADEMYKEHLQYFLPVDTEFTKEAGKLQLQLTFLKAKMEENGTVSQIVRKTAPAYTVEIVPISAWSDIIPDSALTAIDQRLIKMDAQIQAIRDAGEMSDRLHVDGLAFNKHTNELQLTAEGNKVGNVVVLNGTADDGEGGTPVIPTDPPGDGGDDDKGEVDNVTDF